MHSNDNHDAHDYGERIRERLPRRLQEIRERCGLSREYIGKLAAMRWLSRSFTKKKTLGYRSNMGRTRPDPTTSAARPSPCGRRRRPRGREACVFLA
jgi:hypothetical protein